MLNFRIGLYTSLIFGSALSIAADRYVATSGNNADNDCTDRTNPCLTLQHAIDASVDGDNIDVAAGTYSVLEQIVVNKSISILGSRSGVDARTRVTDAETVFNVAQGIVVSASNVIINGLTIQGSTNATSKGFGVWLNPGIGGTIFLCNIIQKNVVGLGLANAGEVPAIIQYNLFQNNNEPGPSSGIGIYTDQHIGGVVSNVLIDANLFHNNSNAGIALNNTDTANPNSEIFISHNQIINVGRGIYLVGTINSLISNNAITNMSSPADGGESAALRKLWRS